jgi:hypothetical protein
VKIYVSVFGLPCFGRLPPCLYICTDGAEYKLFTRGTYFDPNSTSNNGYDAKSVLYVRI